MSESVQSALDHPRLPGKIVYVLGAGFSRALGMPLISNFIAEGMNLLKISAWNPAHPHSGDQNLVRQMQDLLRRRLPMLRALGGDEPTIEDVFCSVDLLHESNSHPTDGDSLRNFVARVCCLGLERHTDALEKVKLGLLDQEYAPLVSHVHFKTTTQRGVRSLKLDPADNQHQRVCAYGALLSQVSASATGIEKPRDPVIQRYACPAIISLNYDLVVESKVAALNSGLKVFYGSKVAKRGRVTPKLSWLALDSHGDTLPLLKLHGSINWIAPPNSDHRVPRDIIPQELCADVANKPPPLIFPTWQRDSLARTVFDAVLQESRVHLRLASRIVVIGYSMPTTDRYIRYLLADALNTPEQPELEICNGWDEQTCRERVGKMFGARVAQGKLRNYPEGFLEFVSAHRESKLLG